MQLEQRKNNKARKILPSLHQEKLNQSEGVSNVWNGIWTGIMEWNNGTDACVTNSNDLMTP